MEIRQDFYGAEMKVLVACEFSGIVREAFKAKGHDAWSCDLLPTEIPGQHIQGDVLEVLGGGWDMMIGHPPCTDLACSGAKHFYRKAKQQDDGIWFVAQLMFARIPKICIENPVGIISSRIKPPDQIIQPYDFGEPYQKTTCLWLKNLPPLKPTAMDAPLFGEHIDKGEFHITSGGNKLPQWYEDSRKDSNKNRSRTFPGIAAAMANQWG